MTESNEQIVEVSPDTGIRGGTANRSNIVGRQLQDLKDGILETLTFRIDFERFGYQTILVWVAVDLDLVDEFTDRLRSRPEFITVYEVSGSPNVFAIGKFPDAATLGQSLKSLLDDPTAQSVSIDSVELTIEEASAIEPAHGLESVEK